MTNESRGYLAERLKKTASSAWLSWLSAALKAMPPDISVPAEVRTRIHRFRIKAGNLVAFERNIDYQMSEVLKQAGGNEALETVLEIEGTFQHPAHVYDLRAGKYLGQTDHIHFTLDPWRPSLFALLREKLPADSIVTELLRDE